MQNSVSAPTVARNSDTSQCIRVNVHVAQAQKAWAASDGLSMAERREFVARLWREVLFCPRPSHSQQGADSGFLDLGGFGTPKTAAGWPQAQGGCSGTDAQILLEFRNPEKSNTVAQGLYSSRGGFRLKGSFRQQEGFGGICLLRAGGKLTLRELCIDFSTPASASGCSMDTKPS